MSARISQKVAVGVVFVAAMFMSIMDGTTLLVMPQAAHEEHDSADPIRYP